MDRQEDGGEGERYQRRKLRRAEVTAAPQAPGFTSRRSRDCPRVTRASRVRQDEELNTSIAALGKCVSLLLCVRFPLRSSLPASFPKHHAPPSPAALPLRSKKRNNNKKTS